MKRLPLLLVLASAPACAQQAADPALGACQQLLANANNQTIATAAQASTVGQQLQAAQTELTKLRSEAKLSETELTKLRSEAKEAETELTKLRSEVMQKAPK